MKVTTFSQMSKSSFMTLGGTIPKNDDYSEPAQISKGSSCESRNRPKSQENSRILRLKNKFLPDQSTFSPELVKDTDKMKVLKCQINE